MLFVLALLAGCGGETTRQAAAPKCLVRVYFCAPIACGRPATRSEIRRTEARLRNRDDVYAIRFVSKEEACQVMRGKHPVEVDKLMGNPFRTRWTCGQ